MNQIYEEVYSIWKLKSRQTEDPAFIFSSEYHFLVAVILRQLSRICIDAIVVIWKYTQNKHKIISHIKSAL